MNKLSKPVEKAFEKLGTEFNLSLDRLSRLQCPTCNSYTLEVSLTVRAGVRFSCRGWKPGADDDCGCDFHHIVSVTSPTDLPDINEKVKAEVE